MKILYVGNAQGFDNGHKYYLFPQRLINGMTRIGHNVYVFNDRDVARHSNFLKSGKLGQKAMNESLIQLCKDYRPDLIILGHCERVFNETLLKIKYTLKDVKICYRNVDPLDCQKNIANIKNRSGIVDGIFVTTAGDVLKQFACDKTFSCFLPNPVDISLDTAKSHDYLNHDYDLTFIGSSLGKEDRRREFLERLIAYMNSDVKLNIIGCGINELRVFGSQYIDVLSKSKMGLILNKTEDFYLYSSDRMSQYLGNGLLCLCSKGPQYTDIFTQEEIVEYNSEEDLSELLLYYSKNTNQAQKIAKKGYEKAHKFLSCELVSQYIIEQIFNESDARGYAWPTKKYY